jgi:protein-S-isoprenylcysteine O-methyltransferase Ste14
MLVIDLLFFIILSTIVIYFSRHVILHPTSHGFYRFFSWECIAWLIARNYQYWFDDPFCWYQLISWVLLFLSLIYLYESVSKFIKLGKAQKERVDSNLYTFEKTTELIEAGFYKYIRHPMYGSLLFLTWGIFFKNINIEGFIFSTFSSIFLFITAKIDEKECKAYFGDIYANYMNRTKMFVPFVF